MAELLETAVRAVGGIHRDGQAAMAEAVAAAVTADEHLVVQAGTGTGKSLAYLVPAIHHAATTGGTVVVSTATITLQRQLVERDLPRISAALKPALAREPSFAILKGRGNYLCLQRLNGPEDDTETPELFDPSALSDLGRQVKRLHEWAQETETGDRDELIPGVGSLAWRQVSVSANECLGAAACPFGDECFAERARAQAADVDVVVTNHALLAIDAAQEYQILPERTLLVVDEAHELSDRVTSVSTGILTERAVSVAAKRAARVCDAELSDRLAEAADGLALFLADTPPGRLDQLPDALSGAVASVRDAALACTSACGAERGAAADAQAEGGSVRKLALAALTEVHDTAVRVLKSFEVGLRERTEVVWLAKGERQPSGLHVAPLSVSGLLREKLFGEHPVILTSATLSLGGSFDPLAAQWGLGRQAGESGNTEDSSAGEPLWRGLDVGSPFDHSRSGILYIAQHLPQPGREGLAPEYFDEIAELITAAGGRTLGLFSSMRAATQAAAELSGRVDYPIRCQGEDSTGQLVREFAEDPRACLFGTLSLWQGVDVPGPSLQLVIVDRIPFPRPDDPLASARQRAVSAQGGNGFMAVAASHAALLLAQGTGRLLRSMEDRGVVAVLDPRLGKARYGGFLRASLPPYWTTTDPGVVRAALRRLDQTAEAGDQLRTR